MKKQVMNLQKSKVGGRSQGFERGKEKGNDVITLLSQKKKREKNKNLLSWEGISSQAYTYYYYLLILLVLLVLINVRHQTHTMYIDLNDQQVNSFRRIYPKIPIS